jgi:HD-like signal output (HDOD) protein
MESDQAIAAKVLKMANSAYYGKSGKISSIHQASLLLGYQTLGEIITLQYSDLVLYPVFLVRKIQD